LLDLRSLLPLAALELALAAEAGVLPGRCARCQDRAATAIAYVGVEMPPEGDPEACVCGWAPHLIEIEFVTRPLPRR
jgi:hypothetical protein